jgi:hypothetical protein
MLRHVCLIVLHRGSALVPRGDLCVSSNTEHTDDCRTYQPVNWVFHSFAPAVGIGSRCPKVKAPPGQAGPDGQPRVS